jgi:hypothetical protein
MPLYEQYLKEQYPDPDLSTHQNVTDPVALNTVPCTFLCRRAVPGEREPERADCAGTQLRQRGLGHSVHEVRCPQRILSLVESTRTCQISLFKGAVA